MATENDVFISYRRDGGGTVARLLYEVFKAKGIRCFMDAETLGEGNFGQSITQHLENAENFVFIVSPGVFDRCSDPNDWVRKEIEGALQKDIKIIPVFVNGVTGFPPVLPEAIATIAGINAFTLSHEHFDAELDKMIGCLTTKNTRLIEKFIHLHDAEDEDDIDLIFGAYKRLEGEGNYKGILGFLTQQIRNSFRASSGSQTKIETLLEEYPPWFLKDLCEKVGVDATGSSNKMLKILTEWVQDKEVANFDADAIDGAKQLSRAFAAIYKSHADREKVKQWAETLEVKPDSKRSSRDIFDDIFDCIDVEEFFDTLKSDLSEEEIKILCGVLDINNRGRKNDLIERIKEYVDNPQEVESV